MKDTKKTKPTEPVVATIKLLAPAIFGRTLNAKTAKIVFTSTKESQKTGNFGDYYEFKGKFFARVEDEDNNSTILESTRAIMPSDFEEFFTDKIGKKLVCRFSYEFNDKTGKKFLAKIERISGFDTTIDPDLFD